MRRSTFVRAFPWAVVAVLALAVWHDHSRGFLPWAISLALSFSCGWLFRGGSRGRQSSRRTSAPRARTLFVRAAPQQVEVVTIPAPRVEFVSMPAPRSAIREVQTTLEAPPAVLADLSSALVNMGYKASQAKRVAESTIARLGAAADMGSLVREALKAFRVPASTVEA